MDLLTWMILAVVVAFLAWGGVLSLRCLIGDGTRNPRVQG